MRLSSRPVWLFVLALAARLPFLLLAGNNGGDAWARYQLALAWANHPDRLPSDTWLPLHFWLLGTALRLWHSEWAVRLLTALLGALTVLPFWGAARRLFGERVALYAALMLALFGFHIAYSVTTSSEVPTVFFLALGLYGWLRFREEGGWRWLVPAGLGFSLAALIRFEAWFFPPVLGLLLLDFSGGWRSAWSNRRALGRAAAFVLAASAGGLGWMVFSGLAFGDPLLFARRSFEQALDATSHFALGRPLAYRLAVLPGLLLVLLSPPAAALVLLGVARTLGRWDLPAAAPAIAALVVGGAYYVNAVARNMTMARYTLLWSWLLIPYAFEGLRRLPGGPPRAGSRRAFAALLLSVLVWQAGIVAGAHYGPGAVADKLSSLSPTLPLRRDLRALTAWLRTQTGPGEAVVVDNFNHEASEVVRIAGIPFSQAFRVPYPADPEVLGRRLAEFVAERRPRLLVYSPRGHLRHVWPIDDRQDEVVLAGLGLRLRRRWEGGAYRVYEIEYRR